MSTLESARSGRPVTTTAATQERRPKTKKQCGKFTTFLLSCCLFLSVICTCMVAALIIIGKHYLYNDRTGHINDVSEKPRQEHLIQRLREDVRPSHYDVTLIPNLDTGLYTGTVNITLQVAVSMGFIELHSNNLSIGVVSLQHANNLEVVELHHVKTYTRDQILKISAKQTLYPGNYHLVMNFKGSLLKKTDGFYRSTYIDSQNRTRYMATTKFEPTYARKAFPCFDEPDMKAAFTVHLMKPKDKNYIALSNMPQQSEEEMDEGMMVHFQTSVNMSTYLVCFIVCDFEFTESYILDKIPFRVYSAPNQIAKTEYAKNVGKKVIEFYIDYFGLEYPLPKLDMAAIPDFVSGAMENWGMITYRETALLFGEEISSTANKQRVATVVAHEFAHSWFGNLVTMRWWNDIWLNEGFASYIEYKGVNFAEPDWHIMDHFLVEDLHPVLNLDSKLASHPIVKQVVTPDEIAEIFDKISYSKGASVLRMLEDTVGIENFKNGVTAYLKNYAYGNTVTQNLWDELQTIVGDTLNVTEFMATWTLQMGYPIVEVRSTEDSYILTQRRFLRDPNNEGTVKSPFNYRWKIPITYISSENSSPTYVMFEHSSEEVTVPKVPSAKWVKFNYNQIGYYRVNYEEAHWRMLIKHIDEMTVPDKVHLLEESFRIAQTGQLSYDIPLELTKYLTDETGDYNYLPWDVASTMLKIFKLYLRNSPYLDQYKRYVLKLVSPAYDNLTWTESENENHNRKRARVTVLKLACAMGHKGCLTTASDLFVKYLDGEITLSQNLRTLVYNYGVEASSTDRWNQLWDRYIEEGYASEKQKLMTGLTYTKEPAILTRLLALAEDETYVRSQDYFSCLINLAANPIGTPIVWEHVREIWPELVDKFGLNERYLGRLIPSITNMFTTQTKLEEIQSFFAKYPEAGAGASARAEALENVKNNIQWLQNYKEDVERWVKNNGS